MESPAAATPDEPQRTSASIRSYARNARRAVWLQLVVAVFAFAVTVGFGIKIREASSKLEEINDELETSSARVIAADDATRAVLEAAAALATREPERYAAAIASLQGVRKSLASASAGLDEQSDRAAVVQLRDVRVSVTGTLARILFSRPDRKDADVNDAIALAKENLREQNLKPDQRFANSIALATFHCDRKDPAAVRSVLSAAFVAEFPQAGANGVLPDACRAMANLAPPSIEAFDASKADPAYRLRTVYIQVGSDTDRIGAAKVALALCNAGYDVPGIERVDAGRVGARDRVLYYYDQQASEAAWLAQRVADERKRVPAVRRLSGFGSLDRHTVELWLAAMDDRAAPPANIDDLRRFKGCVAKNRPAGAVDTLVAQLISDSKQDRLSASQSLANQIRAANDSEVIAALLGQLEGQKLDHLSAAGRLNVLYLLNIESSWSSRPERSRLAAALDNIRAGERSRGIVIGSQTLDCMNQLARKLDGSPAADRCGGL